MIKLIPLLKKILSTFASAGANFFLIFYEKEKKVSSQWWLALSFCLHENMLWPYIWAMELFVMRWSLWISLGYKRFFCPFASVSHCSFKLYVEFLGGIWKVWFLFVILFSEHGVFLIVCEILLFLFLSCYTVLFGQVVLTEDLLVLCLG